MPKDGGCVPSGPDFEAGGTPVWEKQKLEVKVGDDSTASAGAALQASLCFMSVTECQGIVTDDDKKLSLLLPDTCPTSSGEPLIKVRQMLQKLSVLSFYLRVTSLMM